MVLEFFIEPAQEAHHVTDLGRVSIDTVPPHPFGDGDHLQVGKGAIALVTVLEGDHMPRFYRSVRLHPQVAVQEHVLPEGHADVHVLHAGHVPAHPDMAVVLGVVRQVALVEHGALHLGVHVGGHFLAFVVRGMTFPELGALAALLTLPYPAAGRRGEVGLSLRKT